MYSFTGDSVEIPFRYEHRRNAGIEVQNFQIMTSSYKDSGVDVEFSIECNGLVILFIF
jgi:hypothetical protein